jgi:hypothetical protein
VEACVQVLVQTRVSLEAGLAKACRTGALPMQRGGVRRLTRRRHGRSDLGDCDSRVWPESRHRRSGLDRLAATVTASGGDDGWRGFVHRLGRGVRGREKQAVQVFQESMEYYGKLQQEGRIESFDVLLLAPHGGDLAGFVVLRGDRKALAEIRFSDEFERLVARASAIIDSLGVLPAYGGDALAQRMGLLQEVADEFGG